eukprot:CAMPEP_0172875770 /NCGR_PEP_ID=MMETSP1075-20121228/102706_1 /TAXON_ID=2916 /ORGANISM="Ceratium fusus, Strain PA161109" /LENGTH=88 /DNA_ID=CAMNT_0013726913 /DNA_START=6 /DNA_END=272 /DNA_ORIENTATION=+
MASVVDTKVAVKTFKQCVKDKGGEACQVERKAVVIGVAGAVKGECAPFVDDFFGCFVHRYHLSTCSDATVAKMIKCQEQSAGHLLALG